MKEAKDKAEELIEKFGIEKAILCVFEVLKTCDFKQRKFWNKVK